MNDLSPLLQIFQIVEAYSGPWKSPTWAFCEDSRDWPRRCEFGPWSCWGSHTLYRPGIPARIGSPFWHCRKTNRLPSGFCLVGRHPGRPDCSSPLASASEVDALARRNSPSLFFVLCISISKSNALRWKCESSTQFRPAFPPDDLVGLLFTVLTSNHRPFQLSFWLKASLMLVRTTSFSAYSAVPNIHCSFCMNERSDMYMYL